MEHTLTGNNFYVMEPIQIKQEPNLFDSPENIFYAYEGCQIKIEPYTSIAFDEPKLTSFNEYVFDDVNSISIKRENIDEKFVTSDLLDKFDIETVKETMPSDNCRFHPIFVPIFATQSDIIGDKSNLALVTTIVKSEYEAIDKIDVNGKFCAIEQNSLGNHQICTIVENSIQGNFIDKPHQFYHESNNRKTNKRKLIKMCQNDSSQSGVSPKRRKTDEIYLYNNNYETQSPKTKEQTTSENNDTELSDWSKFLKIYYAFLEHSITTVNLKELFSAKVILERINVDDYLAQKNVEKLNNISNIESDLTNALQRTVINTKKNNKLKSADEKKNGIKTNLDEDVVQDVSSKADESEMLTRGISCKKFEMNRYCGGYCTQCDKTYNVKELNKVTKNCPECKTPSLFECKKCKRRTTKYNVIYKHVISICFPRNGYKCDNCNYETTVKDRIVSHMQTKHLESDANDCYKTCSKRDKPFTKLQNLKNYEKFCLSDYIDSCTICFKKFKRKINLIYHMQQHQLFQQEKDAANDSIASNDEDGNTNPSDWNSILSDIRKWLMNYCSNCEKMTEPIRGCKKCKECSKTLSFRCGKCNLDYSNRNAVYQHIRNHHLPGIFDQCPKCGRNFFNHAKFLNHRLRCNVARSVQCNYCRFKTKTNSKLARHIRNRHSQLESVKCDKCGNLCKNSHSIKKHQKYCSQEPKLQCDHCPFKPFEKVHMIHHMIAKHVELYSNAMQICGKKMNNI